MEWGEPMLVHLTKKTDISRAMYGDLDHQRQRNNQKAVCK